MVSKLVKPSRYLQLSCHTDETETSALACTDTADNIIDQEAILQTSSAYGTASPELPTKYQCLGPRR
jgi:hypothetical protein